MWTTAKALSIPAQEQVILQNLIQAPSTPQGIAMRARIVLLAGEGIANYAIARRLSIG